MLFKCFKIKNLQKYFKKIIKFEKITKRKYFFFFIIKYIYKIYVKYITIYQNNNEIYT